MINTFFQDFFISFNRYRKKSKMVKDEKKLHGTVDESSSEQQFQTQLPLLCEKFGAIATPSASPTTNFTFLKHTISSTLLTLRTKKAS